MSNYALRAENLVKQYYIGTAAPETTSLLEYSKAILKEPWLRLRSLRRSYMPKYADDTILALNDISFDVKVGEVLGIIGHNGAGKSTLLKILSRITLPTSGRARVWGQLAALLEVGTGFHEELTGRENIYLNGSILGMSRTEIDRKLDAIVDFAGVETYLDTPVKRYSSGMRVRLGFAVAAHLEPEILLVDEVLAVGDLEFQRRSLGKMNEAAQSGRTVLFISHNMQTIANLCPRSIWLHRGKLRADGETKDVIKQYTEASIEDIQSQKHLDDVERTGSGHFRFTRIEMLNASYEPIKSINVGDKLVIHIHYVRNMAISFMSSSMWLTVRHETRGPITILAPNYTTNPTYKAEGVLEVVIDRVPWIPGNYFFDAKMILDNEMADVVLNAASLITSYGAYYEKPNLIDTKTVFLVEQSWQFR